MSKRLNNLTQNELKSVLKYNPETGHFIWTAIGGRSNAHIGKIAGGPVKDKNIFYICIKINGRRYLGHRLAYLYMTGDWPGNILDHDDGDGTNNKWKNINLSNHHHNAKNCRISKNNTSGVTGVGWDKRSEKWHSQIMVNGRNKGLGSYFDINDAIKARKEGETKYGFNKNHGRGERAGGGRCYG